jgi:predicted SAM-dependent methyltransferase
LSSSSSLTCNDDVGNAVWLSQFQTPYSLHLGCSSPDICPKQDYIIIDVQRSLSTHIQGTISNLKYFPDSSVKEIYSSHTLEHLSFYRDPKLINVKNANKNYTININSSSDGGVSGSGNYNSSSASGIGEDVCSTLIEWRRVMLPGGRLRLSVPDVDTLFKLFIAPNRTLSDKKFLMAIIYGGQDSSHNYHKTGFSFVYLKHLLENTGFCNITRVAYHKLTRTKRTTSRNSCNNHSSSNSYHNKSSSNGHSRSSSNRSNNNSNNNQSEIENIDDNVDDDEDDNNSSIIPFSSSSNLLNKILTAQKAPIPEFLDTSMKTVFNEFLSLNIQAYACDPYENSQSMEWNCIAGYTK